MFFITLTQHPNKTSLLCLVRIDQIKLVGEKEGHSTVWLSDGTEFEVIETVQQIFNLINTGNEQFKCEA